ncbi:hypothetical protein DU80_17540 [Methanosarcina mazei]|uniref:Uncharacterized protein n=1 Tax=Methanosarcina mazei TaxID=2209 RepID=A0A0F8NHW9_METMZ|nr:hypothetical protein DU40_05255 [Methanosarcina mazei]KKG05225.1 hypothetical protein DU47_16375 [Methanosarcina mazei]KKG07925.1 hypothetical protein DU31_18345 [Methanosarcina mazei]KKG11304.1 hypothetical protein DU34_17695 [Methanosarcina mazei]KKG30269.1 hypothetical protein DU52_05505 [Methanosarcina mazei]
MQKLSINQKEFPDKVFPDEVIRKIFKSTDKTVTSRIKVHKYPEKLGSELIILHNKLFVNLYFWN